MRKALFFLGILSDTDVEWMIRNGSKARLPANTNLIRQGEPTDSLYFVLDGEFEVFTQKAPHLALLRAGDVIGEISFIDSRPPTASVRSLGDSQLGVIPLALLTAKLKQDMGFSSRFYRAMATFMADRLRTTVGQFGTGRIEADDDADEDRDDIDEVAPNLMDTISMAGARFSEMQRRTWG